MKKAKNFDVYQEGIPSEITPAMVRVYGEGMKPRVPEFVRLLQRGSWDNPFTVTVKGVKFELQCSHVLSSMDGDDVYADMRAYTLNDEILFVFSKGAFIKPNESHKVAERYLIKILGG